MKRIIGAGLGLLITLSVSACLKHEKPNFTYMPDMAYGPSYKAQEKGSMRMPVEGTLARNHEPYPYKGDPQAAGERLRSPLKRVRSTFQQGKELFNIYCMVCHGPMGEGDGTVVPKFPRPPSLLSDKVRNWPDGRIFHVMTEGQNLMPSYASQVNPEERWAIVHYIRAIQRAKKPTRSDLEKAKNW